MKKPPIDLGSHLLTDKTLYWQEGMPPVALTPRPLTYLREHFISVRDNLEKLKAYKHLESFKKAEVFIDKYNLWINDEKIESIASIKQIADDFAQISDHNADSLGKFRGVMGEWVGFFYQLSQTYFQLIARLEDTKDNQYQKKDEKFIYRHYLSAAKGSMVNNLVYGLSVQHIFHCPPRKDGYVQEWPHHFPKLAQAISYFVWLSGEIISDKTLDLTDINWFPGFFLDKQHEIVQSQLHYFPNMPTLRYQEALSSYHHKHQPWILWVLKLVYELPQEYYLNYIFEATETLSKVSLSIEDLTSESYEDQLNRTLTKLDMPMTPSQILDLKFDTIIKEWAEKFYCSTIITNNNKLVRLGYYGLHAGNTLIDAIRFTFPPRQDPISLAYLRVDSLFYKQDLWYEIRKLIPGSQIDSHMRSNLEFIEPFVSIHKVLAEPYYDPKISTSEASLYTLIGFFMQYPFHDQLSPLLFPSILDWVSLLENEQFQGSLPSEEIHEPLKDVMELSWGAISQHRTVDEWLDWVCELDEVKQMMSKCKKSIEAIQNSQTTREILLKCLVTMNQSGLYELLSDKIKYINIIFTETGIMQCLPGILQTYDHKPAAGEAEETRLGTWLFKAETPQNYLINTPLTDFELQSVFMKGRVINYWRFDSSLKPYAPYKSDEISSSILKNHQEVSKSALMNSCMGLLASQNSDVPKHNLFQQTMCQEGHALNKALTTYTQSLSKGSSENALSDSDDEDEPTISQDDIGLMKKCLVQMISKGRLYNELTVKLATVIVAFKVKEYEKLSQADQASDQAPPGIEEFLRSDQELHEVVSRLVDAAFNQLDKLEKSDDYFLGVVYLISIFDLGVNDEDQQNRLFLLWMKRVCQAKPCDNFSQEGFRSLVSAYVKLIGEPKVCTGIAWFEGMKILEDYLTQRNEDLEDQSLIRVLTEKSVALTHGFFVLRIGPPQKWIEPLQVIYKWLPWSERKIKDASLSGVSQVFLQLPKWMLESMPNLLSKLEKAAVVYESNRGNKERPQERPPYAVQAERLAAEQRREERLALGMR